jgi:pimeloyl-ACP methyl ester carboxylesterase
LVEPVVRRYRIALLAAVTAVASVLLSSQASLARDEVLVVANQNLYIETLGSGGPAIVLEAGLGNDSTTWKSVAATIATFAQRVVYDRAGLGRSLPMIDKDSPVTADEVTAALHALLADAAIRPPYILVGHSLGGLYVQRFASRYPAEVSGVVLIDSSSPDAPSELKTRARLEPGTAAYLEEEGIAESNRQVLSGGPFPPVPLTVIAATDHGPYFKAWESTLMQLQRQLATLSPRSTLVVAEGSGHDVHIDRPDIVIDAVRRMAKALEVKQ